VQFGHAFQIHILIADLLRKAFLETWLNSKSRDNIIIEKQMLQWDISDIWI
jgi:hypothetical protein